MEYFDAPFTISDSIFGSCFYWATCFHGFHVIVGTISLFVSKIQLVFNHYTNTHYFGFESAIWYWPFVDGCLVIFIYNRLLVGRFVQ